MFNKTYLVLGLLLLAFYGVAEPLGWEFGGLKPETPQEARARRAAGGSRTPWFHGFWGGK